MFKELGTEETVKNLAFAAVTGGAIAGAGNALANAALGTAPLTPAEFAAASTATKVVTGAAISAGAQSAIYSDNLGETFVDRLKSGAVNVVGAEIAGKIGEAYGKSYDGEYDIDGIGRSVAHKVAHAGLGCAMGAASGGNCGTGAIGGAVAETAAELYSSDKIQDLSISYATGEIDEEQFRSSLTEIAATGGKIGQFAALGTSLVTGADAEGIYTTNNTATNAVENNNPVAVVIGAAVVAGYAMTAKDAYDAYQEGGAEAAMKSLAVDGAISIVATGAGKVAYKVGGKLITSADEAWGAYLSSSKIAQATVNSVKGVKGFVAKKVTKTAEEVNAPFIDDLVSKGVPRKDVVTPWAGDVTEFVTTQEQKVYRVFSGDVDKNMAREWVFTQKTFDEANTLVSQGKYATQFDALQDMLSIPTKPTSLAKGTIPSGTTFRTGIAEGGTINGNTFKGGAQQIEILLPKEEIDKTWFTLIK